MREVSAPLDLRVIVEALVAMLFDARNAPNSLAVKARREVMCFLASVVSLVRCPETEIYVVTLKFTVVPASTLAIMAKISEVLTSLTANTAGTIASVPVKVVIE